MEAQGGAAVLQQAVWPPAQKQCISDNASSQSSITECHQAAVHVQPVSWQRATSAPGTAPGRSHDHCSMDSDATEAQRQASGIGSQKKSTSDTGAQRVSSRLRKRQRDALNTGEIILDCRRICTLRDAPSTKILCERSAHPCCHNLSHGTFLPGTQAATGLPSGNRQPWPASRQRRRPRTPGARCAAWHITVQDTHAHDRLGQYTWTDSPRRLISSHFI